MITYAKIEVDELDIEVEFSADCRIVDHGIGPYECHGFKGNDVNRQPTVEDEISWDQNLYDAVDNNIIKKFVDEHYEEIATAIENNYQP